MCFVYREVRGVQPTIVYGRTCEELPTRPLRQLRRRVLAAYTGPGGGLTSVNRKGHPPLQRDEPDLDYIDADDAVSDAQPNAYVTSQKPPPRKTLYADMAAYFRKRESPVAKKYGVGVDGVSEGKSMDSLDCEPPSWRGEAPSPLSPHPARAPPSTAFLQFGEGPLNYGLSLPPDSGGGDSGGEGGSGFVEASSNGHSNSSSNGGSCAYPRTHSNGGGVRNGGGGGGGSDVGYQSGDGDSGSGSDENISGGGGNECMMEEVLISCRDETEAGTTTVVNQLLIQPQQQHDTTQQHQQLPFDHNLNPLIMVDPNNQQPTTTTTTMTSTSDASNKVTPTTLLDNQISTTPLDNERNGEQQQQQEGNGEQQEVNGGVGQVENVSGGDGGVCVNGNFSEEESGDDSDGVGGDGDDDDSGEMTSDGEGSGQVNQRAKFMTLDLVEAGMMAGQSREVMTNPTMQQTTPVLVVVYIALCCTMTARKLSLSMLYSHLLASYPDPMAPTSTPPSLSKFTVAVPTIASSLPHPSLFVVT
ncbi:hypothetical protein Pcinc_010500 [Petrolisthes cinctipes]|uniref:Uncharacterized protein n=1 Tax=Petrolisthes cinctipes TaxID=88211 RepID=A0AAE1G577_PETCI|nr:hypothetical protein Pcinc_010500 [Petrolisthes cinctipes]